jgi:hypothetical protein
MEYFEDQKATHDGLCSDPQCPCEETLIPVGQGYLYIPEDCCNFRLDCPTLAQLSDKAERMARKSGQFIIFGHGMAGPILVCEVGAKKRNLDLAVAARDARHWWATGQVPFRPTPRAGEPEIPISTSPVAASAGNHRSASAQADGPSGALIGFGLVAAIAAALWYFLK